MQSNPSCRANAQKYQDATREIDGIGRAADFVAEAFRTGRPVRRTAA